MAIGTATRLLGAAGSTGKSRMAGDFLKWLKNTIKFGATGGTDVHGKELAKALGIRLVPDAIGGTMVGMSTPGDLGDKLIAGGTDALAGAIGGIGLSGLARRGGTAGIALDMAGSMGGAYGSMPLAEQALRMKDSMTGGEGLSPYDKLSEENRKAIEQALLTKLGFGPMY
jgi:hypothetical protein